MCCLRLVTLVAAATALTLFAGCKPKAGTTSNTKDFAFNADAKTAGGKRGNFLVYAGYKPADKDGAQTDANRWENMVLNGELGDFVVAYNEPIATKVALRSAFNSVASQLGPESTVVFAYTGERLGPIMVASPGGAEARFTVEEVMDGVIKAANGKAGAFGRLYLMIDAVGSGVTKTEWLLSSAAAAPLRAAFKEVAEFRAASGNVTRAQGYNGRLSTAFTTTLAETTGAFRRTRSENDNPTLGTFFNRVRALGTKVEVSAPQAVLAKKVFDAATFPPPPASTDASQGQIAGFDQLQVTPINSTQATTISAMRENAEYVFFEISSSWCGPCAAKALQVAGDAVAQAIFGSRCAAMVTMIVNDGGTTATTATEQLTTWQGQLGGHAQTFTAMSVEQQSALVVTAMGHSRWTPKTGAEMNGIDRQGTVLAGGVLPAGPVRIDGYPKFMVVRAATGDIVLAGMGGDVEQPLAKLKELCR